MTTQVKRNIIIEKEKSLKSLFLRWETLLIILFIVVNIMNASISKNYLNASNLFTAISTFLVKGFIAFPMAYILVLGDIDLSVGSTVALSATLLGVSYNGGLPMGVAVVISILCGTLCGLINGIILTKFTELAAMIVTLGTMTLYRGIAEMILGSQSTGGLQNVTWFYNLYYARIAGIPYIFIIFCILAVVFGFVLHKTTFGRYLYAIGNSRVVAHYSGIPVQTIRLICFTLVGFVCGISAIYYASWMGTVRFDIATGYELEAISMVVLGGISTAGGKGNFPGTVISIFTIGLLKYGLGLINVNSQTILMIIGAILIVVVTIPNIRTQKNVMKAMKPTAKNC